MPKKEWTQELPSNNKGTQIQLRQLNEKTFWTKSDKTNYNEPVTYKLEIFRGYLNVFLKNSQAQEQKMTMFFLGNAEDDVLFELYPTAQDARR